MTYSAHDMAQASADGFRSGVASVTTAPSDLAALLSRVESLIYEASRAYHDSTRWSEEPYVYGDDNGPTWQDAIDKGFTDLRDALTRAAAQPQGVWRPIESAPRDGSRLIGLTPFGVEPIKWHADSGLQFGLRDGWVGTEQDSACLPANRLSRSVPTCQPTHWQPLPTPPPAELGDVL